MLPIGTAEDFIERGRARRRRLRGVARRHGVLSQVLRLFVEHPGSVSRERLAHALPGMTAPRLDRELARLDARDQLFLEDGAVTLAYPFAAGPNAFRVRLADGQDRYACCAIDALGIAPMLGQRTDVASPCHHSGALLRFAVDPAGPEPSAAGLMAWVGAREAGMRRVCTTL
jgi:alkylmercury lyase-like protein